MLSSGHCVLLRHRSSATEGESSNPEASVNWRRGGSYWFRTGRSYWFRSKCISSFRDVLSSFQIRTSFLRSTKQESLSTCCLDQSIHDMILFLKMNRLHQIFFKDFGIDSFHQVNVDIGFSFCEVSLFTPDVFLFWVIIMFTNASI